MEDFKKIVIYKFIRELKQHDRSFIKIKLSAIDGIDRVEAMQYTIIVEFLTLKISENALKEIFMELGYPVVERKKRPRIFRKLVDDLSKSNKKAFGNKKLDCCDLN